MPNEVFDLNPVDRITADAIGEPGKRVFYIQARKGNHMVTVICEKEHVAALSMAADQVLLSLADDNADAVIEPDAALKGGMDLEYPLEPAFRAGQVNLGYDQVSERLVVIAYELLDEDDEAEPSVARLWASQAQMRAFSIRGQEVVASGAPDLQHVWRAYGARRPLLPSQERPPDVKASEQSGTTPVLALSPDRILQLLSTGEIEIEGLIPWSSNATLLVTVQDDEFSTLGVYKPQRGERPLWDFPAGTLGKREVAAYLVCEALGWDLIPPTVLRQGPYGLGSVQFFVHTEQDAHFFTIQHESAHTDDLLRLAVYDVIANNADRKSGHCLVGHDGHLWAIDNALTFHAEYKLRTVIWDFAEQPLPAEVATSLQDLRGALDESSALIETLGRLLSDKELSALRRRVQVLIQTGCLPKPGSGRMVPWPLV